MTIREAIKKELAIEVELDVYLLDDGRVLKYDRYWGPKQNRNMWIDENGVAYRNFCEAYTA